MILVLVLVYLLICQYPPNFFFFLLVALTFSCQNDRFSDEFAGAMFFLFLVLVTLGRSGRAFFFHLQLQSFHVKMTSLLTSLQVFQNGFFLYTIKNLSSQLVYVYLYLFIIIHIFYTKKTRLGYVSLFLLQLENVRRCIVDHRRVNARYIFAATKKHLTHSHVQSYTESVIHTSIRYQLVVLSLLSLVRPAPQFFIVSRFSYAFHIYPNLIYTQKKQRYRLFPVGGRTLMLLKPIITYGPWKYSSAYFTV